MTDEEYLGSFSKIQIYCEVLLGILRYTKVKDINNSFYKELAKKLKFANENDPKLFRACIDLLEDTECAIQEVYKNGITTNPKSIGEQYLRLYGVLNSTYLQMQATIDLVRLFNIPNQKLIRSELKSLKIIEIRNKIGAHTTNYLNMVEEKEFYQLAQCTINKFGKKLLIVSCSSNSEEIDLLVIMKQFTEKIESYLDIVCEKALSSLFKNNSEPKEWLLRRLNFVRNSIIKENNNSN